MPFRTTAVMACLLLLLAAACGDDAPPPEETPTPTPTAGERTPPPDQEPTPPADDETPADAVDGAPDVAVAVTADGRVVVIDAADGEEVRELLDGVPVDDPASNDIAVSPDGSQAFVVVPAEEPGGGSEIVRLPIEGGDAEVVAQGTVPAVSPDGGTLAYVELVEPETDEPVAMPEPVLVLHDLDSREETRLTTEEPFHFIPDVEWTADSSRLVFTAGEIHTGLFAVDRDAASLDDAERLGPDLDAADDETSWGPVAAFDDGLAVIETCCGVPRDERWHLIEVDASDGTVRGPLLEERLEATHLDSDGEAAHLLLVVRGGPEGGQLLRWDGEGGPEELTGDVIAAAW